jgi:hypothetical protein
MPNVIDVVVNLRSIVDGCGLPDLVRGEAAPGVRPDPEQGEWIVSEISGEEQRRADVLSIPPRAYDVRRAAVAFYTPWGPADNARI